MSVRFFVGILGRVKDLRIIYFKVRLYMVKDYFNKGVRFLC